MSAIAKADRIEFTDDQVDLVRRTVCKDATGDELALFFHQCRRAGLDPLAKQIYAVKRQGKMVIQVGIDGYRLIADRTGLYAGNDDPVFDSEDKPTRATVTVYKLVGGVRCPFTATARWSQYYPGDAQGFMWKKMPHLMLGKCFDAETEVLTDRGFERFAEVTGRILQVMDDGTLEACDARPFSQDYSGDMVTLDSDDLNFCVTPNHDMVTSEGKVEAGAMFERSRSRPRYFIPRCLQGSKAGLRVGDADVMLSAIYLADGSDVPNGFRVAVSRPRKVSDLNHLGRWKNNYVAKTAGAQSAGEGRVVTTRRDKEVYTYAWDAVSAICDRGKVIKTDAILRMSRHQARIFADTWMTFDGSLNRKTGVRRLYSSRPEHIAAFELACVIAGYSVSPRRQRESDIGTKPNYFLTVSDRTPISVHRWGREYQGDKHAKRKHTGLKITANDSGKVWCVTVPSGIIVVRRNGFSMLCGNCAEALALRKAFPAELSGLYTAEEMDQAGPQDGQAAPPVEVKQLPARPPTLAQECVAAINGVTSRDALVPIYKQYEADRASDRFTADEDAAIQAAFKAASAKYPHKKPPAGAQK